MTVPFQPANCRSPMTRSRASDASRPRRSPRWSAGPLEPRLLLAADAGAAGTTAAIDAAVPALASNEVSRQSTAAADTLVILDASVDEPFDFAAAIPAAADVAVLQEGRDPIEQISELLANRRDLAAVHLLSHGDSGRLLLGGSSIDGETLQSRAAEIRRWGRSLAPSADLLIYGCSGSSRRRVRSPTRRIDRSRRCRFNRSDRNIPQSRSGGRLGPGNRRGIDRAPA